MTKSLFCRTVLPMNVSDQIAHHWTAHQKEIEMVWWLLPRFGQETVHEVITKLQTRLTTCLLMTPFATDSARQIGQQLAEQLDFQAEKLAKLQGLLAEQLLMGLDEAQTAWLSPRLFAFWAKMGIGYGQAVQAHFAAEQSALKQELRGNYQQLATQATESEEYFEALFKASHHPVFLHENGRILDINTTVTKVFGYTARDLVGEEVQTLIQKLTLAAEQVKIREQMQAGREQPYQTQCLSKEGTAVDVKVAARHVTYRGRTVRLVILQPLDEASALPLELEQANLTAQQQAVLQEMANGSTDKEIAERLDIVPATVNYHKKQIFEKLQVNTRTQAAVWAWQNLLPPE